MADEVRWAGMGGHQSVWCESALQELMDVRQGGLYGYPIGV